MERDELPDTECVPVPSGRVGGQLTGHLIGALIGWLFIDKEKADEDDSDYSNGNRKS